MSILHDTYSSPSVTMRTGASTTSYERDGTVSGRQMLADCDLSTPQGVMTFGAVLDLMGQDICAKKNHDYADPDSKKGDPLAVFANFMSGERLGIGRAEDGMLFRMTDKFSRIVTLTRESAEAAVTSESLMDAIVDMRNYLFLLAALIEAKKYAERPAVSEPA